MIKDRINKIFNTKVDAVGLSVFRMCYTLILVCELEQLFRFRKVIFDAVPFVETGEINVIYIFIFWSLVLFLLFIGLFTRLATILNYIFGVIVFSSMAKFEYHVFYAYVGINFLLMFMPLSRVFSLDSLIQKIKYTHIGRHYKPNRTVLEINYLVVVFAAIGLVYVDSVFRKFNSTMWMDGLGMWLPSSLPMIVWSDTSFILNQEWLVKFLGYLVIFFELIFIFLFWCKKFRIPFLILGLFFHFGILITYPIPWFALTAIVVYLLLVPQSFWLWIATKMKANKTTYQFYYDAECPLCNKVIVIIKHFDIFGKINCLTVQSYASQQPAFQNIPESDLLINIHGVNAKGKVAVGFDAYIELLKHLGYTYPIGIVLSLPGFSHLGRKVYAYIAGNRLTERCTSENCQLPHFSEPIPETQDILVSGWNRLNLTKNFWKAIILIFTIAQLFIASDAILPRESSVAKVVDNAASVIRPGFKKALGVCAHAVFMRGHFANNNHIFKIICTSNNKIVPILKDDGVFFNGYANGAMWVNYTFRVSAPNLNQAVYENGITPRLLYFQNENGLENAQYKIYVKEIDIPTQWEHDFLKRQISKPWKEAGTCKISGTHTDFLWNAGMQSIFKSEEATNDSL